jgi:hypothetical protein
MKSNQDKKRDQESSKCRTNKAAKTRLDCQAWNLSDIVSVRWPPASLLLVKTGVRTVRSRSSSQRSTWQHLRQAVAADMADRLQCPCVFPSSFQRHSSHHLLGVRSELCRRLRGRRRPRERVAGRRGWQPMGLRCSIVRG